MPLTSPSADSTWSNLDDQWADLYRFWSGAGITLIFQFSNIVAGLRFQDHALIPLRAEQYLDVTFFVLDSSELDSEAVLSYG